MDDDGGGVVSDDDECRRKGWTETVFGRTHVQMRRNSLVVHRNLYKHEDYQIEKA